MRLEWKPSRNTAERLKNAWGTDNGAVASVVRLARKIDGQVRVDKKGRRVILDFADGSRVDVWRKHGVLRLMDFDQAEARRERLIQEQGLLAVELPPGVYDPGVIRRRGANTPAPPIPWIEVEEL